MNCNCPIEAHPVYCLSCLGEDACEEGCNCICHPCMKSYCPDCSHNVCSCPGKLRVKIDNLKQELKAWRADACKQNDALSVALSRNIRLEEQLRKLAFGHCECDILRQIPPEGCPACTPIKYAKTACKELSIKEK